MSTPNTPQSSRRSARQAARNAPASSETPSRSQRLLRPTPRTSRRLAQADAPPSYDYQNSQLIYLPITDPYPHEEDLLHAQGQGPATGMSDYRTMPSQQHHYPPYQPQQQQQQPPQQQQHYARPNYQHQQGYRPPHPATSQQQQHMAPIAPLARSATDLSQRMGDMKLNGDPQPYGAKMPSRTPGPMSSLPKQQQQYIPRAYGNDHVHNHPAAAPLGARKHSPVQQIRPAPAPVPVPIPMPYDAQAQSSYRAVPAPVPAPAHTPGSGRRSSHIAMIRRSVTAPLPPISTNMEAVPDLPAVTSATTSPARAPAYPGQRVYSPITKDTLQHSKTSSPQRPPSIPPKIPEDQDLQSPVRSLNALLVGNAGNISPTMHASSSYHDNTPMAAVNETSPEGFEFPQQEDSHAEATNGDVAQDHQLYNDNLPENNSRGDFISAFPPQTPSKEGVNHQPSSPSVPPV
ncbi:hypothetical protein KEM56_005021, partial [Ascosphaera pollenicola]